MPATALLPAVLRHALIHFNPIKPESLTELSTIMDERLAKHISVDSEPDNSEIDGFLGERAVRCYCQKRRKFNHLAIAAPWVLSVVFAALTLILLLERPSHDTFGTYEDGFKTDFTTCLQLEKCHIIVKLV